MASKKMDLGGCSRDLISGLPKELIGHILSFLSTKEAASTSVLSGKWRYLFALSHNLDLVSTMEMIDRKRDKVSTSFLAFVDRVLALQGNSPLHKFFLKIEDRYENPVDSTRIFGWILNVLERGVSDVDLNLDLESECLLPSELFLSKTLVRMKLSNFGVGPTFNVKDAYLPKLKTLCLHSAPIRNEGIGFAKLLSGCHALEELDLEWLCWCSWDSASLCVSTLKRLRFCYVDREDNPKSLSFDTPNLVYLEYTDTLADKYPKVNFGSLVEARIDLRMSEEQMYEIRFREEGGLSDDSEYDSEGEEENCLIDKATDFITGLCNVKILYLSANTLETLNYCCEAMPVFNNLAHLTIESKPKVGWQSLPRLLKNSPNLETLVLLGLNHKATNQCGDVCLCKLYEEEEEEEEEQDEEKEDKDDEEIQTCLSSSPVKVVKIMKFAETYDDEIDEKIKQAKHFLQTMPNLEQLILYYDTTFDEDVMIVSSQLQSLPRVASSRCNVQVISDHISLSSIVPFPYR